MNAESTVFKYAKKLLRRRFPERIWIQYCVAVAVILALLGSTHNVNRLAAARRSDAEAALEIAMSQALHAQEILVIAEHMATQDVTDPAHISKAIFLFANGYRRTISNTFWSDNQRQLYFGNRDPLQAKIRDFIALAQRLESATQTQLRNVVGQMNTLYRDNGLRNGLRDAADMIRQSAAAETRIFARTQSFILIAATICLLGQAIFIFFPIHLTFRVATKKLRHLAKVIQENREALNRSNQQLMQLSHQDQLTGLPNRARLFAFLAQMNKHGNSRGLSVLFLGLDNFKAMNDTAGHDHGDALLVAVGETLKCCIDDHNLVARVGGDEFVIVTDEPAVEMIRRVRASLSDPFEIMGRRLTISASIGYLEVDSNDLDPASTVGNAGIALKAAKTAGGHQTQKFTQSLRDDFESLRTLQMELGDAIKRGEVEPWFQPQIRLSDGQLHGAEVLARWRHPTRGMLTPDRFLPAAERAGLMIDLDHTVWRTAMAHSVLWQRENLWDPRISLNAAPDTISDPHLIERFLFELHQSGLNANQVVIEVLETTLIDGSDDMAAINIDSLSECGISLELDDFGTGYASLSKLTQLPLNGIKLDRSLVAPLPDPAADSIVRAILAMAGELGLQVIAEGIEEAAQAQHLKSRGCAVGQGYGYAKPMPAAEFGKWLKANARPVQSISADVVQFVTRA